ncbi:hypothetical protein AB0I54_46485 [Streptomyces sp. NPDC050625]|uniref:hypothetical protein n=1 Tax=Streptomyces sp. NPDC050625 TaxID=3154629 RepID=UPI003430544C
MQAVTCLPRRFDPDAICALSLHVLPGVAGDPSSDLGQVTDLGQKHAADGFCVRALPV